MNPSSIRIMKTISEKSDYMLLLLQPNTGPAPSPDEMKTIMDRFGVWMESMAAKGMVLGTAGLEVSGKIIRGSGGETITDGPYPEAKEIVGGYVLITATDLNDAISVARECPGLDYRMAVEVRPVKHRMK
jgi:hypothetical protein